MPHFPPVRGTVKELWPDGTGIVERSGVCYRFDARALRNATFEELRRGQVVIFEESPAVTVPRARWVALDAGPEAA